MSLVLYTPCSVSVELFMGGKRLFFHGNLSISFCAGSLGVLLANRCYLGLIMVILRIVGVCWSGKLVARSAVIDNLVGNLIKTATTTDVNRIRGTAFCFSSSSLVTVTNFLVYISSTHNS